MARRPLPLPPSVTRSVVRIAIGAPAHMVFRWVAEPETHLRWRPSVVEFRPLERPVAAGTRIVETVRFLGRRVTTTYEVTELEPDRVIALRSVDGPLPVVLRIELAAGDPGTELTFVLDMEAPRPLGLPVPGFHALMRRYLRDEGRRLRELVESGAEP